MKIPVKYALWIPAILATLCGWVQVLPVRSWPDWWDPAWVILLAATAYAVLVREVGIGRARVCAAGAIVAFGCLFAALPVAPGVFGTVVFSERTLLVSGLGFPILPPFLAFSLLAIGARAVDSLFPYTGRVGLAVWTAVAVALPAAICPAFLGGQRLWWAWGPPVGGAWVGLCALALGCGVVAFGLSFLIPPSTRMHTTRWSPEVGVWLLVAGLFAASSLARAMA